MLAIKVLFFNSLMAKEKGCCIMKLNFTNHEEAQDMIVIIMNDKKMSVQEAIISSINSKIYEQIVKAGWADIALDLWGHDDPEREWSVMDNPCVEIDLEEDKNLLVNKLIKKYNIDLEIAVSYFLLFTMDEMGYHI